MTSRSVSSAEERATDPSDQLELFAESACNTHASQPTLHAAIARASISPAWWPLVRALFENSEITVTQCEERDGELILAVFSADEPNAFEGLPEHLRQRAARTCGCCGSREGSLFRPQLFGRSVVVCEGCRARLKHGESYNEIAGDFWHLDGTARRGAWLRARTSTVAVAAPVRAQLRACTTMSASELRETIAAFRSEMSAAIVGQGDAVDRLALLGGLHVGGGLELGGRALILGRSGVGKTSLVGALLRALEPWGLPNATVEAVELSTNGWAGPAIGDVIAHAIGSAPLDGELARHAIIVIDELAHAAIPSDTTANMRAKKGEVLAGLLAVVGHGAVRLNDGREWSSAKALVIGLGAFTGLLDLSRPPTPAALVRAGIPIELATRFGEPILLKPLPEAGLVALLRRWPALASLTAVCERLGYTVRIVDEAYTRAARVVTIGHDLSTARTAGTWLVSALRRALLTALSDPGVRELIITPDCLPITPGATSEPPRDEPPDPSGGWDTTIVRPT